MCNCAKNTKQVKANPKFSGLLSNTQIYNALTDEQKTKFKLVIYNGAKQNKILPIRAEKAVEIGLITYGIAHNGQRVYIHEDELALANNPYSLGE